MTLLSILICSLHSREASLATLLRNLKDQECPEVEVLVEVDSGEMTIGEKRNLLLDRSRGEYVCFIDDDDCVPADYVSAILKALTTRPDCVGFMVAFSQNGIDRGHAIHSLRFDRYGQRRLQGRKMEYERTPNHLNPVRRELAMQVRFPDASWREDTDYAERLRPMLKSEVFIDRVLYHYLYRTRK